WRMLSVVLDERPDTFQNSSNSGQIVRAQHGRAVRANSTVSNDRLDSTGGCDIVGMRVEKQRFRVWLDAIPRQFCRDVEHCIYLSVCAEGPQLSSNKFRDGAFIAGR